MVCFTIPGRLSGKGRPRFSTRGGKVRSFTPAKTVATEAMVREFAAKAMNGAGPMQGPVRAEISIRLNHPKHWSKARKAASVYVTGRPDCDNVCKILFDAANGILWADDAQVAVIQFERRYQDGPEFTRVSIHDLSAEPFARAAA